MGFFIRICIYVIVGTVIAACATSVKGPLSLRAQLEHPSTITLPLIETDSELLLVRAVLSDGGQGKFVVDTGATLSSIFPDVQTRLGLQPIERASIRVHGMIAAQLQPLTILHGVNLGGTILPSMRVAIIPRTKPNIDASKQFSDADHDGIIGMDVLSLYHLYIDKFDGVLKLIPQTLGPPSVPVDWDVVELTRNPFLEDGRQLHFFQLRLGNGLTPALMDTGSQFNMMNWNTQRFPRLQAVKKRLRQDWEIEGAIGTFHPVTKILSKNARAGQKFWEKNEFLVLDFESLDVLGIDGRPFVIVGMPMLGETPLLIDFQSDRLYFAPDGKSADFITVN